MKPNAVRRVGQKHGHGGGPRCPWFLGRSEYKYKYAGMNRNNHEPSVDADLSAEGFHWVKSFLNQPEGVIPPKQAHWLTTENVKNRIKMEKDTRAFDWKCLRGTCTLQEIEWTLHGRSAKCGRMSLADMSVERPEQKPDTPLDTTPWCRNSKWVVRWVRGSRTKRLHTIYVLHIVVHHDTRDCYLCIRRVRGPMGAALTSAEIVPGWIHGNMNLHW